MTEDPCELLAGIEQPLLLEQRVLRLPCAGPHEVFVHLETLAHRNDVVWVQVVEDHEGLVGGRRKGEHVVVDGERKVNGDVVVGIVRRPTRIYPHRRSIDLFQLRRMEVLVLLHWPVLCELVVGLRGFLHCAHAPGH